MNGGSVIRRGAAWVFAGRAGHQILNFGVGVVLARLLAPEDFGALLTIQVFTGIAGFFSGGGMGQALVRAKTTTKADYDVVFTLQLCIGASIYLLFYATAPLFAKWYDNALYTNLVRLSALSFLFRPMINMPSSLLHRQMRFKARAAVGMVSLVASSSTSICLAYFGLGVWSLVWGGIAGSLTQGALLIHLARWRPGFSLDFRRARDLARYGALIVGNDLIDHIKSRVSIFILSANLGPQAVGLYNKGESLAGTPFDFIAGSVYQVLFRTLAVHQENLDTCRYLFYRSITLVSVYGTPFYVGIYWLADPLVIGVYGERWAAAAGPLRILALAWPFWLVANMSGAAIAAHNQLAREIRINIATLVFTVLAVSVAQSYGINGVAWATVAAAVLNSVFMTRLGLRTLGARLSDVLRALRPAAVLNGLLAMGLFGAARISPLWVFDHPLLQVLVAGTIGTLIYSLGLLLIPIAALDGERERLRMAIGRVRAKLIAGA